MIYAISDIHGCYKQYMQLLEKIKFSSGDTLYVLGDVIDHGPQPIEVLRDMSARANVIPIVGNHEYVAMIVLKELLPLMDDDGFIKNPSTDLAVDIKNWQDFGGSSTLRGFGSISHEEREALYEYLMEFSLFEYIKVNGQSYVLTHAGVPADATLYTLGLLDLYDFVSAQCDFNKQYFTDTILVTGHMPTFNIDEAYRGKVYRKNNHMAIDTGGVFVSTFCCVCLDTGEEFFVTM